MASMDLRTLPFRAPIPLRKNFCYGPPKVSVRIIIISASNSYGRRRNAILCPLLVSNVGPVGSLLDTGIQLVKNLKIYPESKIRALQDSFFGANDDFVANLLPAVNSFEIFAASLGFLAGLAVHVSRSQRPQLAELRGATAGDWFLFANPTPFNRFVVLRCPSIAFEDGAFLENVNEKLTKDSKYFVNLSGYSCKGRIPNTDGRGFRDTNEGGSEFMYQRMCLGAEDGGVITLDWPASLDLATEQGLESTLLLVPGTAEGSNDELVQDFVRKALQHGYFPVVMNPRGCAGSPLTTPRLFTAADSDDICIAAQFIARLRPWSTLMGVGWGYGANMLTKYLGEASETTPLTAAVSIGNPFDLDEATRSLSHYSVLDRKIVEGLKNILRCNKVLFQGRKKGFDISRALSATSVREFEMAISRVAHGCDTIENFYAKSSSRETIERVTIPVLFIQNDGIMAPPFSVPRNTIEDNPFTSLLMYSSMPTGYALASGQNATLQWCDNLVIEWLVAVELALLKGCHPLLKDIDITIKPTNGSIIKRPLPEAKTMDVHGVQNHAALGSSADKFLDSNDQEAFDVFNKILVKGEDGGHKSQLKNKSASLNMVQQKGQQEITNIELEKGKFMGLHKEGHSTEAAGRVEESQSGQEEVERGQVLQTAETIMKMLDVTMPGTLANEQRQQVLNAVGRGETLITALQGAVPEEVRGKLTAAVSGAVQAQGMNLKSIRLGKDFPTSSLPMVMKSNSQGKSVEHNAKVEGNGVDNFPGLEGKVSEGANMTDADTTRQQEMVNIKSNTDGLGVDQNEEVLQNAHTKSKTEEKSSDSESYGVEPQAGVKLEPMIELETPKVDSKINEQVGGNSSLGKKIQEDMQEKSSEDNEGIDNQYQQQKSEKSDGSGVCADEQDKGKENTVEMDGNYASEQQLKRESTPDPKNDDKSMSTPGDQDKQNSAAKIDELSHQGILMSQNSAAKIDEMSKREGISDQKNDEKSMDSQGDQNKQNSDTKIDDSTPQGGPSSVQSPTIIVREAFDALTGLDDTTQMAVTNVFGVIENMITHLEKENQHEPEDKKPTRNQNQDQDHSPPQEGSPENDNGNGLGKQGQVPTVSSNLFVSSVNTPKCIDVAEKSGDAGKKKHAFSLNQVQQTIDGTQFSHEVNYNASKVRDGVIQGMENQSSNAIRQDGKDSQMISVSPNTIKHRDSFPWQAKVNDLETFLCPSVIYSPLANSKIDYTSIESTNDLSLDYVPEEGQWKLLDQIGNISDSTKVGSEHDSMKENDLNKHRPSGKDMQTHIIEPSYIILDTQIASDELIEESSLQKSILQEIEQETDQVEDLLNLIKDLIVNALRLEISRGLGMPHIKALQLDLEEELSNVANAVALAVKKDIQRSGKARPHETENLKHLKNCAEAERSKFTILHGEHIVDAISSVLRDTSVLCKLIPFGVVVGATLAALRPVFFMVTGEKDLFDVGNDIDQSVPRSEYRTGKVKGDLSRKEVGSMFDDLTETYKQQEPMHDKRHQNTHAGSMEKNRKADGRAMVGAITASFGATAALATHEMKTKGLLKGNEHVEATIDSGLDCTNGGQLDGTNDRNVDETGSEKMKPNIVSSLAEKAMSVAAPVVPTKKDGEVDHERLVAVLADLGQKGGVLRLVGKAALLWGGLRGAMSLTDRLIMFLRLAERPLHQRLLGFFCMVLLLWSPVVIPLLPTFLQFWTLHTSLGVAGVASIIGLYGAVVILITIWGKRIRGYDQPLEQYGLSISSVSKILNLSSGMTIGSVLVISLYSAYIFLGYATFTLKPEFSFSSSKGFISAIKTCWRISRLVIHAFGMGLAISTIEELLFRSWLHEEIAGDLGFHKAVILSGIVFSSLHWSLPVMPGLWLLSIALSGARAKGNGDLSLPIGLHAALITGNFIMQTGGFIRYNPKAPGWLTGSYVGHPFGGALGLGFVAILALFLYPWNGDQEAQKLETFKKKHTFPKQCLEL